MKVAIYARVSTEDQTELNQELILKKWATDRAFEIVGIYAETGSAWQHADQKRLRELLEDCRKGIAKTVLVFDLSRLTRGGPLETLLTMKRFTELGVQVMSYRESWIEQFTHPSLRDAFIALIGYVNEDHSRQKSLQTKAGMARAKAQGKHIGRPRKRVLENINTLLVKSDTEKG